MRRQGWLPYNATRAMIRAITLDDDGYKDG
jgi:hypothetical protein